MERGRWLLTGGLVLAGLGAAVRFHNAYAYPILMGFDAVGNWHYVELLLAERRLPDPAASWSTGHPPLFYLVAAAIAAFLEEAPRVYLATRLLSSVAGLAAIGLVVRYLWTVDPGRPARGPIAGALLLFLPVHIYMSAMFGEEVLTSALVTVACVGVAAELGRASGPRVLPSALLGMAAGAALLTKLSGLLVIAAGALALLGHGFGHRERKRGLACALSFVSAAALVGGWFYLRNWVEYGFLYPHGLPFNALMKLMPPGSRGWVDYLYVPLATFSDPNLVSPTMLHSVWGGTWATLWWDGHRHFLPRTAPGLRLLGTMISLLALLPMTAFAVGAWRGVRRLWSERSATDLLWLSLCAATLAGYGLFTWQNPWFATVKASFLLGLAAPFAVYSSEVLADWIRSGRWRGRAIGAALATLWIACALAFTYGLVFEKHEDPGLQWRGVSSGGVR